MTEDRLPLAELLEKAGDGDFLRAVAEAVRSTPASASCSCACPSCARAPTSRPFWSRGG
jgi:hypothetical protein